MRHAPRVVCRVFNPELISSYASFGRSCQQVEAIRSFNYAQTAAVLLMVIVSLIDLGSAWLRERVI